LFYSIVGKIQDQPEDFYSQFQLIISGLDNIETRRWINQKLFEQTQQDPPQYTYLIDGGTEGLKGQARIMVPGITVCFECTLDLFPPKTKFPLCTLANTPRLPEHCIEWASLIHWPELRPDEKVDGDNWDHIQWLYTAAKSRADAHNIEGVTLTLTQGVVKNIIPAIASTNAIVAANCCNEAFKVLTMTNPALNNYATYNGVLGVSSTVIEMEKSESCFVCSNETVKVEVSEEWTLSQLLLHFKLDPKFQAKNPSVRTASKTLYMSHPVFLEKSTRKNLELPLSELVGAGDQLSLTDPVFPNYITVDLVFKDGLVPPKEDTLE
jgi:ubiquitin-activating enzyme E1 C